MFKGNCWHEVCAGYSSKDWVLSYSPVSLDMTLLPISLLGWKSLSTFANSSEDTSPWASERPGVFHRTVEFPHCTTSFHYCSAKALVTDLQEDILGAWLCPCWRRVQYGGLGEKRGNFTVICVGGSCESWSVSHAGNTYLHFVLYLYHHPLW